MSSRIVVGLVEDDSVQAQLFEAMLASGGLTTRHYTSVQEYRRRKGTESIDVLLLDWYLPGAAGVDLLRTLRERDGDALPILILTTNSDERDVVYALRSGADDYIVKPPRPNELVARVHAAHRRANREARSEIANCDPFFFDLRERQLLLHGEPVGVTEREFDLPAFLFRRPDRVVSREMLLTEVWNTRPDSTARSIDTYVSRLRRSLGLNGESGWVVSGVYQSGYRLSRVDAK